MALTKVSTGVVDMSGNTGGLRMFDRAVTASEVDTIYNEVPEYT